nr:hypothetical protein Iba_chr13aCG5360 [Ipomoea batatas]
MRRYEFSYRVVVLKQLRDLEEYDNHSIYFTPLALDGLDAKLLNGRDGHPDRPRQQTETPCSRASCWDASGTPGVYIRSGYGIDGPKSTRMTDPNGRCAHARATGVEMDADLPNDEYYLARRRSSYHKYKKISQRSKFRIVVSVQHNKKLKRNHKDLSSQETLSDSIEEGTFQAECTSVSG